MTSDDIRWHQMASNRPFRPSKASEEAIGGSSGARLLDRDALGEISGLVDVLAAKYRGVIRQQLQWNH